MCWSNKRLTNSLLGTLSTVCCVQILFLVILTFLANLVLLALTYERTCMSLSGVYNSIMRKVSYSISPYALCGSAWRRILLAPHAAGFFYSPSTKREFQLSAFASQFRYDFTEILYTYTHQTGYGCACVTWDVPHVWNVTVNPSRMGPLESSYNQSELFQYTFWSAIN